MQTMNENKNEMEPEFVKENQRVFKDSTIISVDILHVIKDAQAQHGLRHGDYQRYHGYCNRRLKRIRKVLKFKMGEKRRVIPKKVTEQIFTDARYILLLLMTSERAWGLAMFLKQEVNSKPRKRHHMVEKLRKSVLYASELNSLCESSELVDARTKLEAQAYYDYINGVLKFELTDWSSSKELFRKTQTIYSKLSDTMSKEEQSVYKAMVEEIETKIRYCGYIVGDQSAIDELKQMHGTGRQDPLLAEKLDSLIAESRELKSASMSEIEWRGRRIRVKNSKVRLFLIGIKEFDKDLLAVGDRESQIRVYEEALSECKDALQSTKEEIKTDPYSKIKEKSNQISDLQYLYSYLSYIRLTKTICRNLLLVSELQCKSPIAFMATITLEEAGAGDMSNKGPKPSDFIRLYDVIQQNLSEIISLPGISNDDGLHSNIEAQQRAFQAFRCFYIAQSYVIEKKWTEAMALYKRVLEHANSALKGLQLLDEAEQKLDFVDISSLESLIEAIAFNKYRVHSSAVLESVQFKSMKLEADMAIPLMNRLNIYHEDPALSALSNNKVNVKVPSFTSKFPPSFEPIPCKPLFFDLAVNHSTFPSLEAKVGSKATPKKSGITGMISNWWGWGGKK